MKNVKNIEEVLFQASKSSLEQMREIENNNNTTNTLPSIAKPKNFEDLISVRTYTPNQPISKIKEVI